MFERETTLVWALIYVFDGVSGYLIVADIGAIAHAHIENANDPDCMEGVLVFF